MERFAKIAVTAVAFLFPSLTGCQDKARSNEGEFSVQSSQNGNPQSQETTGIVTPSDLKGNNVREATNQREIRLKNELVRALNSPINFWGKVVDEEGNPVSGARAEISITNKFSWNPTAKSTRTKYLKKSDSNGLFSLLDKKGGSLYVSVHAEGYAPSKEQGTERDLSRASLSYSGMNDSMHFRQPTLESPMVFVLRKKHTIANLSHSLKKRVSVSRTGDVQEIELATAGKTIRIEVRCWSTSPVPFTYDRYDWRAEIKIVGGNLQAITESEPITAPTQGYQQIFRVEMPGDIKGKWLRSSPNGKRDFWVKFDDGTYAKASIRIKTGRKHEVDAEIWYNLDGTNNFEQ